MKRVLVDLSHYGEYNGFGEICKALGKWMSGVRFEDMRITFLVRRKYIGAFGDGVDYLAYSDLYKFLPILLPKFDLWHATDQQPRIFPCKRGGRVLLTIHDLNYRVDGNPRRVRKYDGKLIPKIKAADKLVYITNFTKGYVESCLDVSGKESEVVYEGLGDMNCAESERPSFIREGRDFVFTVGRLNPTKNQECLLDAAKEMEDMDFFICGAGKRDLEARLKGRIEAEAIRNVWITGAISDGERRWMYENAAAFVFPSLMEGFGLPPIEAMYYKCPVVSSDRTSLAEVCGGYAEMLHEFDGRTIADATRRAIERGRCEPEFLEAARNYVMTLTLDKTVRRYLEIYREMLGLESKEIVF